MNRSSPTKISESDFDSKVSRMSIGNGHVLALTDSGKIYAWGWNAYGQLGLGDITNRTLPTELPYNFEGKIVDLGCGYYHSVLYTDDGAVYAWGFNGSGQLGTGNNVQQLLPARLSIPAIGGISQLSVGYTHNIILSSSGKVYIWGDNSNGQLGLGDGTNRNKPTELGLPLESGIKQVGASYYQTYALSNNGEAYLWGSNDNGQLGLGDKIKHNTPTKMATVTSATSLTLGTLQGFIIASDGAVYTWGFNGSGQLGTGNYGDISSPTLVDKSSFSLSTKTIPNVKSVVFGETAAQFDIVDGTTITAKVPAREAGLVSVSLVDMNEDITVMNNAYKYVRDNNSNDDNDSGPNDNDNGNDSSGANAGNNTSNDQHNDSGKAESTSDYRKTGAQVIPTPPNTGYGKH